MNISLIIIGVAIFFISLFIYLVKNIVKIKEKFNNSSKKTRIILYFFANFIIVLICILLVKYIYTASEIIFKSISFYVDTQKANLEIFKKFDEKIQKEDSFYNDIIKKDYGEIKKEPYILDGFEYVEGDIDSGYVVQDDRKNQYVWVPCTNKESEDVVRLEKKDFGKETYVHKHECADLEYEEFLESALRYGGFYISRYEIGTENGEIVSKPNVEVLFNLSRENAINKVENMYNNINCKLINGYAYDVTLNWIKKTNEISIQKVEIDKLPQVTSGRLKYNNIYDFTDNIMEVTLEECYDTVVYRGFDYNEEIELNSRYNIPEKEIENFDNYLGIETMNKLAFRTIIYK